MKKLAIVVTHPIQYYVPIFRLLSHKCVLKVFYTWGAGGLEAKYDPGFGKTIAWDLPLLDGYEYELLENTSTRPGSHHSKGIVNPDIISKLKLFAPSAILVYGYSYSSHLKLMRYFKNKVPIWFRGDSTLLDETSKLKKIAKKLYLSWIYSFVDKAFYVGTRNKAYFNAYGIKNNQLFFAPHAIDNERFSENRELESLKLREKLGIAKQDILILFAGKLEEKKNPRLLLEAFIGLVTKQREEDLKSISETSIANVAEMIDSKRAIHLLFVGNGILEENLKSQISNFRSQIHFLDFQNQTQMPVVYQACDIFCLPSQGPGETWGLAVNEAMASKKAIIVSEKVGCAIDLVKTDINGYIFQSGDKDDLIEKISMIVSNNEKNRVMGQHSSEIISEWNFKAIANTLITHLSLTT